MQNKKSLAPNTSAIAIYRSAMLSVMAFAGYSLVPTDAHAAVGFIICQIINYHMYTGYLAHAIGTVGVLLVAVGAALGRMSWTLALTVAVGIGVLATAGSIAANFGGGC